MTSHDAENSQVAIKRTATTDDTFATLMTSMHLPIAGRISGSITEPSCRFLCREIIQRPQWYQSAWGEDVSQDHF